MSKTSQRKAKTNPEDKNQNYEKPQQMMKQLPRHECLHPLMIRLPEAMFVLIVVGRGHGSIIVVFQLRFINCICEEMKHSISSY